MFRSRVISRRTRCGAGSGAFSSPGWWCWPRWCWQRRSALLATPESVARAAGVYLFLLAVFRVSGRRTLAQVTNFDLVLVLIIGDATQQALVGSDYTLTSSLVVISTLVLMDIALGQAKQRWRAVDVIVDGLPLPLIIKGEARKDQMASEGVTIDDVLTAAREAHGIARLDQVDSAVLEQSGGISIVRKS